MDKVFFIKNLKKEYNIYHTKKTFNYQSSLKSGYNFISKYPEYCNIRWERKELQRIISKKDKMMGMMGYFRGVVSSPNGFIHALEEFQNEKPFIKKTSNKTFKITSHDLICWFKPNIKEKSVYDWWIWREKEKPCLSILIAHIWKRNMNLAVLLHILLNSKLKNKVEIIVASGKRGKNCIAGRQYGDISVKRDMLLRKAKGEYICFIDDDDIVPWNYVDTLVDCIEKNSSNMSHIEFNIKYISWAPVIFSHCISSKYGAYPNHLNPVKRRLALKCGGFSHGLIRSEDKDYAERLSLLVSKDTAVFIDKIMYYYLDFPHTYIEQADILSPPVRIIKVLFEGGFGNILFAYAAGIGCIKRNDLLLGIFDNAALNLIDNGNGVQEKMKHNSEWGGHKLHFKKNNEHLPQYLSELFPNMNIIHTSYPSDMITYSQRRSAKKKYKSFEEKDDITIKGNPFSEKYWIQKRDSICHIFTPCAVVEEYICKEYPQFKTGWRWKSAVGVHMRLDHPDSYDIPISSYRKVLHMIQNDISTRPFKLTVYIFTDNYLEAYEKLRPILEEFKFIFMDDVVYIDFLCLSRCDYMIISRNSTFSWWAVWFAKYKYKRLKKGYYFNEEILDMNPDYEHDFLIGI